MDHLNLDRRSFLKLLCSAPLVFFGDKLRKWGINSNPENLPNFLVLVFDALTAKHMWLNSYERETTPNLQRLSQNANVYHQHHAGGNFTTPGTTSLLTGVYPWSHRALHIRGKALSFYEKQNFFHLLPEIYYRFAYTQNPLAYTLLHQFHNSINHLVKIPELAIYSDSISQSLLNHDFFVSNEAELSAIKSENDPPSSLFLSILDSLYREYKTNNLYTAYQGKYPRGVTSCQIGNPHSPCFLLNDSIDWIQIQLNKSPQPFLGYIHLIPPHAPYNPPHPFTSHYNDDWKPRKKPEHIFSMGKKQSNLNRKRRFYDQYIEFLDSEIGRLFEFLTQKELLENTYIFITSDHGEMFERGIIDHLTPALFEPILHIPLILFSPGQKERIDIHTHTSAVDILPTIMQLISEPIPKHCEGYVLPNTNNGQLNSQRSLFAVEGKQNPKTGPLNLASLAILKDAYKLVLYRGYPETDREDYFELYNIDEDPEELVNIYDPFSPYTKLLVDELLTNIEEKNGV